MDGVVAATPDTAVTGDLVFRSHLLRPWLIANFVAFTIGFGVGGGVLDSIVRPHFGSDVSALEAGRIQAIGAALGALVMSAVIGTAQWLVIRRSIRAGWWMPAGVLGSTLAAALASFSAGGSTSTIGPATGPVPPLVILVVIVPLAIVLPGAGQWLILRRVSAAAGWWPLVTFGAFGGAGFVGLSVAKLLPWIAGTHYPSAQALSVVGLVAGPVFGYLTWQFLGQLRRRSPLAEGR